ncbi:hypothetical protein D6C81_05754 [Aureobasidium pullulans]|nr:hypothetical protein D6C81_05754 [Aureobasidium pullulans]
MAAYEDGDSYTPPKSIAQSNYEPESRFCLERETENEYSDENPSSEREAAAVFGPQKFDDWLPLTLRLPYLAFLTGTSVLLSALVFYLTITSFRNQGLGDNDDSATRFFEWRFLPTLIATIYSLLVATLVNDVRRTECFARLSNSKGASAVHTICLPSRAWWNDPADAWSKNKNNGIRSWSLLCASVVNIAALLVVSPLSAILLSPVIIRFTTPTSFSTLRFSDPGVTPNSSDLIVFRTTIAALLNEPTSAWLSTDHAIVPFWPSALDNPPLGPVFEGLAAQNWSSQTNVYQAELDCAPMSLAMTGNDTYRDMFGELLANLTFEASSKDGCSIVFSAIPGYNKVLSEGGGWWAPSPYRDLSSDMRTQDASVETCAGRSMVLVGTALDMVVGDPYTAKTPRFDAELLLCSSKYFSSKVDATVAINQTSVTVMFDVDDYYRTRRPLSEEALNPSSIEQAFFASGWSEKFGRNPGSLYNNADGPWYGGPLSAIAAGHRYNEDPRKLQNLTSLLPDMKAMFQQFFGEKLLENWTQSVDREFAIPDAKVTVTKARIIASEDVGFPLAVLLLCSGLLISGVAYLTRLERRPLNLSQEPGKIESTAALILGDSVLRELLCNSDKLSQETLSSGLKGCVLGVTRGQIFVMSNSDKKLIEAEQFPAIHDARPAVIRLPVGALLTSFLFSLLAGLAVLYRLSSSTGFYQTPVAYQLQLHIAQTTATLAPYTIVPTFLAIGAKLWFAMVTDSVQKYQPFVAMMGRPANLSESISVEYHNTPTALVSLKALKSSHWLLALLGVGAFASEAFTVSMSALWYRELRDTSRMADLSRGLKIRTAPSESGMSGRNHTLLSSNDTRGLFIPQLYDVSLQNWLYSATTEITQHGITPAWSKDTWSFLPMDLSGVDYDIRYARGALNNNTQIRNLTLQTTGLKASLDCHSLNYASDPPLWLTELDFLHSPISNDVSLWNDINRPSILDLGYTLKNFSSATLDLRSVKCCANDSMGQIGDAVVGYWSNAYGSELTSTWIHGRPIQGLYTPNDGSQQEFFVWQQAPQMSAVSCKPRIEAAKSLVTIDIETGVVYEYEIIGKLRNVSEAWSWPYSQKNITRDTTTWDDDGTYPSFEDAVRVNASWGYLFWDAVINSGQQGAWFRFQDPGLNVDLMSYSMLHLANDSREALLDPETLAVRASTTFGIFFKHFANWNITWDADWTGYVYEKDVPSKIDVTISVPTDQLLMSPVAAIMSMSILVFLIFVTIIMFTTNRHKYKAIPRDVNTLASILGWVYASDRLLAWAESAPPSKPWYQALFSKTTPLAAQQRVRMGPFVDSAGNERWGIEMVDTEVVDALQEDKAKRSLGGSAGESIELQHTDLTAIDGNGDLGAHERLLNVSNIESDTIACAHESVNEAEHEHTRRASHGYPE